MMSRLVPYASVTLLMLTVAAPAQAVVPNSCLGSGLFLSVWGVGGGEYAWSVDGDHRCVTFARGTLTVDFDSGVRFSDACTALVRCTTHLGGLAALGDCLIVEAKSPGATTVIGSACVT